MPHLICPTCRKKFEYANLKEIPYRPFCSRRCKLVDLGKWLSEEYRISEPMAGREDLPADSPPQDHGPQ